MVAGPGPSDPTAPETVYRHAVQRFEPIDIDLEQLVTNALDRLPESFRSRLGSVAIVIADEPSPEELASVGASGLLGLYQGVPRTAWYADASPNPSKITIFRGPLLRTFREPARLAAAVEETVYHEIAHHFGISDSRLAELKSAGR